MPELVRARQWQEQPARSGGVAQRVGHGLVQRGYGGPSGAAAGFRSLQLGQRRQLTQLQDPVNDAPHVGIDGHEAFGLELAERDVQVHLSGPIWRRQSRAQIDALADADARGAVSRSAWVEIVGALQLLLQKSIVFGSKRSGQVTRVRREILAANQIRRKA